MKKLLLLILLFTITVTMTACSTGVPETPEYDIPKEGPVVLNELQYSSYLSSNNPVMTIEVANMGEMKLQLFPSIAPITVDAIISYIERGDYENNEFHRVINEFMIQAGRLDDPYCSFLGEMNNNEDFTGTNDLSHFRGVLSMARVGGFYNSQSSQFFIVDAYSPYLDDEYAGFGGLISGFNILDFIAAMQEEGSDVPTEKITITNITIELNGYEPSAPVCD